MPSCATPVADGMEVRTNTERVQQAVRYAMEFLDIDMMRCIYCGFCVDACPEEAIIMSREHH